MVYLPFAPRILGCNVVRAILPLTTPPFGLSRHMNKPTCVPQVHENLPAVFGVQLDINLCIESQLNPSRADTIIQRRRKSKAYLGVPRDFDPVNHARGELRHTDGALLKRAQTCQVHQSPLAREYRRWAAPTWPKVGNLHVDKQRSGSEGAHNT